jgi:hypothetical protein
MLLKPFIDGDDISDRGFGNWFAVFFAITSAIGIFAVVKNFKRG